MWSCACDVLQKNLGLKPTTSDEAETCRKRWKSLADQYRGYLAKEDTQRKSGSGQVSGKPWVFMAVMSFLKPHMARRDTTGNMTPSAAARQGPSKGPSRKRAPPANHTSTTRPCLGAGEGAGASSSSTYLPGDYVTLFPYGSPAAQGDEDSLPPPPPTEDSSTFSFYDVAERQTQDNPEVQQSEEEEEEEEEEEYVPVPRKVRRHQANPQHKDMTPFQEALVNEMAITATPTISRSVPQALDMNELHFLAFAKMVNGLSVRNQARLRFECAKAYTDIFYEELGEQAPP